VIRQQARLPLSVHAVVRCPGLAPNVQPNRLKFAAKRRLGTVGAFEKTQHRISVLARVARRLTGYSPLSRQGPQTHCRRQPS
jgi:hypothetical protein